MTPPAEFAAFVGIEWVDAKHAVCLQTADHEGREFAVLPHRVDAIEAWGGWLRQRVAGRPVAVCLEIAKGPLVYGLQKYDFLVLFPINQPRWRSIVRRLRRAAPRPMPAMPSSRSNCCFATAASSSHLSRKVR